MINLDKLVLLQKVFKKEYNKFEGLCAIDESNVHLVENDFKELFEKYETNFFDKTQNELTAYYKGVKFIALEDKNEN